MTSHRLQSLPAGIALRTATVLLLVLAGCQSHEHRIGGGAVGVGEESARQLYWLFGVFRVNEVNVQRMAGDLISYDVRSEFGPVDLLLAPLLFSFTMTSRTVTVEK